MQTGKKRQNFWLMTLSLAAGLGSVMLLTSCGGGHGLTLQVPTQSANPVRVKMSAVPSVPRVGTMTRFTFTLSAGGQPVVGVSPLLTITPGTPAGAGGGAGGHAHPQRILRVLRNGVHEDEHEDNHEGNHEGEHADEHEGDHEEAHQDEHEGDHEEAHQDEHEGEHEDEHADEHEDEHPAENQVRMTHSDTSGRCHAEFMFKQAGPHTLTVEFSHNGHEVSEQFLVIVAQ